MWTHLLDADNARCPERIRIRLAFARPRKEAELEDELDDDGRLKWEKSFTNELVRQSARQTCSQSIGQSDTLITIGHAPLPCRTFHIFVVSDWHQWFMFRFIVLLISSPKTEIAYINPLKREQQITFADMIYTGCRSVSQSVIVGFIRRVKYEHCNLRSPNALHKSHRKRRTVNQWRTRVRTPPIEGRERIFRQFSGNI